MDTPLLNLTALAIRHIAEEPNELARAEMLDAAAAVFGTSGQIQRAEQLATTAAIIRESANAQLQLRNLFS